MKKTISLMLCTLLALTLTACTGGKTSSLPEKDSAFMTISAAGELVMRDDPVPYEDLDKDGTVTLYDVLYAAHELAYEGGAAAGLASEETQYGLSLTKMWGIENGGSYGYYINNVSAMSLYDPVAKDDHICVYAFADLTGWADMYCWLAKVPEADGLTLQLTGASFDANWTPIDIPVAGAVLTVDGQPTDAVTDENGCAAVPELTAGTHIISADGSSAGLVLVPPVYRITVQ